MSSSVQPMPLPRVATCLCLQSLQMAVFDDHGRQVQALQLNLLEMWAERAEDLGYHVDELEIELQDGKITLRKADDRWFVDYSPKFRINVKKL